MKFIKKKKAFTLIELVISITISSIIFFIVFSFVVDSVDELTQSNYKMDSIDDIFSFRNVFSRYVRWWYMFISTIWTTNNSVILLKNASYTDWYIFWVVNRNTMKIQKDYIYWDNTIWYRRVTETEINDIEADSNKVYNLSFFNDKIFEWIKVKDFNAEFYNSWAILDIYLSSTLTNDLYLYWQSLTGSTIKSDDLVEFNFNF